MKYYGYSGRYLYVDLTTGSVEKKDLNIEDAKKYIGSFGLNQKIAYDLLKPDTDPLSPDNPIIIGAGPLVGTLVPSSGKVQLTTKSTNPIDEKGGKFAVTTASGGSNNFGSMLKNAGYDEVIITGRAPEPSYLMINDDDVEICSASDLWGNAGIYETADILNERHGRCGVWTIGRAGEKLVQFAHGVVDSQHTLGRNGGAAVAGSKNLKAIAVKGTKGINIWDQKQLRHLVKESNEKFRKYQNYFWESVRYSWRLSKKWLEYYPASLISDNFLTFSGCSGCSIGCKATLQVQDGELEGTFHKTAPAMMIGIYGRRLEIKDYRQMMALVNMFNALGLDYVTIAAMLKFVTRLYERGIINKNQTDGLELAMGDFNAYSKLTERMANRDGEIGNAMADGWFALSDFVGVKAWEDPDGENIAKGVSTLFDARFSSLDPTRFVNAVNPKPGQHHHGITYVPGNTVEQVINWYLAQGVPQETIDRIFSETNFHVGRLTKIVEDQEALLFCLGTCVMPIVMGTMTIPDLAKYYMAVTGVEKSVGELRKAGERTYNLQKLLNVREGFTREDDKLPKLWDLQIDHPIQTSQGEIRLRDYFGEEVTRERLEQMFDGYYDEHGWDIQKGIPTVRTLSKLELDEYADALQ